MSDIQEMGAIDWLLLDDKQLNGELVIANGHIPTQALVAVLDAVES